MTRTRTHAEGFGLVASTSPERCRHCGEPLGNVERGHATSYLDDPYRHDAQSLAERLMEIWDDPQFAAKLGALRG